MPLRPGPNPQPSEGSFAVEQRRFNELKDQKLEDVLEVEIKKELAKSYEKPGDRLNLIKAGIALVAVKNKIVPEFGSALDEPAA